MRKKTTRFSNSPQQLWSKMIVFFLVLVGVGLSIFATAQNQSLIQRAQESSKPACPPNQVFFPIPGLSNSMECTLNGTPGYFICNPGFVYVPPNGGSLPSCIQAPAQSEVQVCPSGVQNVTAGAQNSTNCLLSGILTAYCNYGYIPRANTVLGGPSTCVPSSCTMDKCVWGANQDGSPICKDSGTVLGCNIGGCKSGQQLLCSNGSFTCVNNSSACPVATPIATPTSNNCPAGVCVYKDPASSASYACGMAGLMPGTGTCSNSNNTCCVTSTYVAKCSWDASKTESVCTRDGVNRQYVNGAPTRPVCCAGLTENGQGTCECKVVTSTPLPTPVPTSIPVQTPKPTSVVIPTSSPKPTPKLTNACDSLGFSDTFDSFALAKQYTVFGSGIVISGQLYTSSNSTPNRVLDMSIPLSYASQYSGQVGIVTTQAVQGTFRYAVDVLKFSTTGKPFTFSVENGKTSYGIRTDVLPGTGTYRLTSEQRTIDTNQIVSQQSYALSVKGKLNLMIERTVAGTIRLGYSVDSSLPVMMQTFSSASGDFKGRLLLAGPTTKIYLDNFTLSCL